jgi:hypothetical protein
MMISMDPIAVATLAFTVIGAVAASLAAYFAWKGPTKQGLSRVEANTGETARQVDVVRGHVARVEDHLAQVEANTAETTKHVDAVRDYLAEQNRREALEGEAGQLSISVSGGSAQIEPLKLLLTLKDHRASLLRIGLLNNRDMLSGTFDCERVGALEFTAAIDPPTASSWFASGDHTDNFNLMRLQIRAFFKIDGREANRTFAVHLCRVQRAMPQNYNRAEDAWQLDGRC